MHLNADFTERAVVTPSDYRWVDSPIAGVERMMLDRIGDEVARATSIVRYAPNSEFPEHTHGGGEEILVLDGEFADDHGSYPTGFYVRNPIGTKHAPKVGPAGSTILVKLHQFDPADTEHVVIDTNAASWQAGPIDGIDILPLHRHGSEQVSLARWAANTRIPAHPHEGGEEVFVIRGCYYDELGEYPAGSWVRSPHGSRHEPYTGDEDTLVYLKTGHLQT